MKLFEFIPGPEDPNEYIRCNYCGWFIQHKYCKKCGNEYSPFREII
jgi:hypothetical protein